MVCPVSDVAVKSSGEVAVPSAVAISKITPPAPAGEERLTVKSNEVVPLYCPLLRETSLMESEGVVTTVPFGVSEKSSTERPSSEPG